MLVVLDKHYHTSSFILTTKASVLRNPLGVVKAPYVPIFHIFRAIFFSIMGPDLLIAPWALNCGYWAKGEDETLQFSYISVRVFRHTCYWKLTRYIGLDT